MTRNKLSFLSLIFISLFVFFSCATTSVSTDETEAELLSKEQLCPKEFLWQELEPGFAATSHKIEELGLTWYCIRIDLSTPDLYVNIKTSDSPFRLKSFAKKNRTIAAINTTPFTKGSKPKLLGTSKVLEKTISEPVEKYAALGFYYSNGNLKAKVITHQTEEEVNKYDYTAGGFFQILSDGQVDYSFKKYRHSRSWCGINQNTNQLYLLAVSSVKDWKDNNGLTYPECALILQALGCTEGMEFDGGHSTGLCIYTNQVSKTALQCKIPAAIGFRTN